MPVGELPDIIYGFHMVGRDSDRIREARDGKAGPVWNDTYDSLYKTMMGWIVRNDFPVHKQKVIA
jgi:hypothetical protein